MGDWTGTVPVFAAGAKLPGVKMQTLADIDTALVTAWTTWTPTLTNLTLGSGVVIARYRRVGKTLDYRFKFTYGAGSAVGTSPQFTLPATPHAGYAVNTDPMGDVVLTDSGTAFRRGIVCFVSSATLEIFQFTAATGNAAAITSTSPWTWTTNDSLSVAGTLELA